MTRPNGMSPNGGNPLFEAIKAHMPAEYGTQLESISVSTVSLFETALQFALGGACPETAAADTQQRWKTQQLALQKAIEQLQNPSSSKRTREDDSSGFPGSKKSKTADTNELSPPDEDDTPLFTLHAISITSPLRKKVDITIHKSSIRFTNPSTHALESNVPLVALKRAFLLPTRGKTKAHWTVVLLSSDTPAPSGKASAAAAREQPQVIFGVDAVPSSFSTTDHATSSVPTVHPKGTAVVEHLRTFLGKLPFPVLEPSPAVFRSAVSASGTEGVAGIEAYRGAKPATLWFLSDGVLWDGKPSEFWALEDIVPGALEGMEGVSKGVRTVSATGRTCSIFLGRRVDAEIGAEEEEEGIDTDFGMIDGKEQEPIARWVKKHRHLFGKKVAPTSGVGNGVAAGKAKDLAPEDEDEEDEEDEDFVVDSSSDGGSATSSDSDSSSDEREGSEEVGSGSEEGSNEDDTMQDEDEEEELRPENHPLLRPGAMPRMSRAAMDAVVGIVQEDFLGIKGRGRTGQSEASVNDEEDELED